MELEELKQEAEEYADENVPIDTFGYRSLDDVHYDVKQAYIAGAEPREKRITELEESNREWQKVCEAKSDTNSQLVKQLADKVESIAELEKENAELKEKYVKNITDCDICDTYCNSQLIKAKELLQKCLNTYLRNPELRSEVKNFLKE